MGLSSLAFLLALVLPGLALAHGGPRTVIVTPGYPSSYSNGYTSPSPPVYPPDYPPTYQGVPGASPFSGGVATGAYPPGARTCVAADQTCPATAPNTVGAGCACPGRDGRPIPGIVR